MNPDQYAFILMVVGVSGAFNVALLVALLRANRRLKRLDDIVLGAAPRGHDELRDERLEQSLEVLRDQIEQLASGQEFLNRVVARQGGEPRAIEPPKVNTPH